MAEETTGHDESNPVAGVAAICAPHKLTISQMALLSRVNSPVLFGDASDIGRCLEALYLVSLPVAEAYAHVGTAAADALEWGEKTFGTDMKAYADALCPLLDAIAAFWKMLPSSEKKKE